MRTDEAEAEGGTEGGTEGGMELFRLDSAVTGLASLLATQAQSLLSPSLYY